MRICTLKVEMDLTMHASFSDLEYAAKKKVALHDRFLCEIEVLASWSALAAEVEPFRPKGDGQDRSPISQEHMQRMYIAQQCSGLSDKSTEDAIHDSQDVRRFIGINLVRETAPDTIALLKFRRLPEKHQLTERIFTIINRHLDEKGLMPKPKDGTVVDATIITTPATTKNQTDKRGPDMHQTKKGKQWHFGMKAHVGTDANSSLVHTLVTTPANTNKC